MMLFWHIFQSFGQILKKGENWTNQVAIVLHRNALTRANTVEIAEILTIFKESVLTFQSNYYFFIKTSFLLHFCRFHLSIFLVLFDHFGPIQTIFLSLLVSFIEPILMQSLYIFIHLQVKNSPEKQENLKQNGQRLIDLFYGCWFRSEFHCGEMYKVRKGMFTSVKWDNKIPRRFLAWCENENFAWLTWVFHLVVKLCKVYDFYACIKWLKNKLLDMNLELCTVFESRIKLTPKSLVFLLQILPKKKLKCP